MSNARKALIERLRYSASPLAIEMGLGRIMLPREQCTKAVQL